MSHRAVTRGAGNAKPGCPSELTPSASPAQHIRTGSETGSRSRTGIRSRARRSG
jgi:hypothetical protein